MIHDFSQADYDLIDLSAMDASTIADGDQSFSFIGTAAFTQQAGQLHQVSQGSSFTVVEGDLNGDGRADFQIALSGLFALKQDGSDFIL